MVFIIRSKDFVTQIPESPLSSDIEVHLSGFPTLYLNSGIYVEPANLWINHLVNERQAKDINSSLRAIARYWSFLESNCLAWDVFPPSKYRKPTYLFRNNNLLASVKAGEIQLSTASLYLNHVVQFYRWAMHEGLLYSEKQSRPFESELLTVSSYGKLAHMSSRYIVKSTDLRIPIPKKNLNQSLNPLTKDEVAVYTQYLGKCCIEFQLHQMLQLLCGLRVREACTFPLSAVHMPANPALKIEVEIGPHVGVETKFGAKRRIEVSAFLMHQLYLYSISERRYLREKKCKMRSTTLLINKFGKPYKPSAIQSHFGELRRAIRKQTSTPFKHRTHDMRSTYATFRLASLLSISELPPTDAVSLLMGWMGHRHERTTWKYIQFLNKQTIHQKAVCLLDEILEEAIGSGGVEHA